MPSTARERSITSTSRPLGPAARCDRPSSAPSNAVSDQPDRLAVGPEPKFGLPGRRVGDMDVSRPYEKRGRTLVTTKLHCNMDGWQWRRAQLRAASPAGCWLAWPDLCSVGALGRPTGSDLGWILRRPWPEGRVPAA